MASMALLAGESVGHRAKRSSSDTLRDLLLRSTLIHAAKSNPYFVERFAGLPIDRMGLDALRDLPVMSKADLTNDYDGICRPTAFPATIMYTSGTEGREMLVPVSIEEIASAEQLLGSSYAQLVGDTKPLTLSLVRVGHGSQHFSPSVPMIPAHVSYGPDQVIDLLGRSFELPGVASRITVLEGNLLTHMKLIAMMREKGVDGRDFGIELVLTTGWYVTPHKRRMIEDFWGATLLDRYGVTEVNGDSKQCPSCGAFHFDPFVIAEAVDPVSGQPVENGPAELILTGLFPFNQVAPKIRYALGDLVWRDARPQCGMDEPGYRFLGRARHSIIRQSEDGARYVLFPTEVADVIDEYPEVVRRKETGFLCFASEWRDGERPGVITRIEWTGENISERLAQAILARSTALRSAVEDGLCEYRVELVPAGTIATISKL